MSDPHIRWLFRKYIIYCTFLTFLGGMYFSVGYLITPPNTRPPILLKLDTQVPFIPITGWLYLGLLAWVFIATPIVIRSANTLYRLIFTAIVATAFNFAGFILMPIRYPRPIINSLGVIENAWGSRVINFSWDHASAQYMSLMYLIDPPSCTFPALHVTYPAIFALALQQENKAWSRQLWICAAVLWITTWTTKQHFILDGLVGALTACIGYAIAVRSWTIRIASTK